MRNAKSILLVEDDRVDAMSVQRALHDIGVTNLLAIARNGQEALAYLEGNEQDRPCLILLDLNMPRINGLEFLHSVKADDRFRQIPVVVLTTSRDEQDKQASYTLGAAGYILKPIDYWEFVRVMKTIDQYWTLCELPE